MKILYALVLSLITITTNPKTEKGEEITLGKEFKVESTFSGNTQNEDSFHLIIAKNTKTKKYDIIPYLYGNGEITKLESITYGKLPSILSFHNNEGMLSLIVQSEGAKSDVINVVDVDLSSGTSVKSKNINEKNLKAIIRQKDKNLLVVAEKSLVKVIDVKNSESIETIIAKPDQTSRDFFKNLSKGNLEAINKDEFVANGSINEYRVYGDEDSIILTQEDSKAHATNAVEIPLNTGSKVTVGSKTFTNSTKDDKIKKSTSYVQDDKLYQLQLGKSKASLDVFGLSDESNKTIDLLSVKPANKADGFKDKESFIKQAKKGAHEPTVTVNNTKNGNLKVRVDYVDKNTYNYRYDWWWHHHMWMMHHNHMMWHQQQVRNSIPKFGPSEPIEYFYTKEGQKYFEIVLDPLSNVLDAVETEMVHKELDKKKYVEELDGKKKLKHTSSVFTKQKFRYIAYNKKAKSFKIVEEKLDD